MVGVCIAARLMGPLGCFFIFLRKLKKTYRPCDYYTLLLWMRPARLDQIHTDTHSTEHTHTHRVSAPCTQHAWHRGSCGRHIIAGIAYKVKSHRHFYPIGIPYLALLRFIYNTMMCSNVQIKRWGSYRRSRVYVSAPLTHIHFHICSIYMYSIHIFTFIHSDGWPFCSSFLVDVNVWYTRVSHVRMLVRQAHQCGV